MTSEIIIKTLSEQGVLGTLVILLFMSWRSTIRKLIKLVENNTQAMTINASILKEIRSAVKKCEK